MGIFSCNNSGLKPHLKNDYQKSNSSLEDQMKRKS